MPYTTACSCVTSGTRYKHKKNDTGNNTASKNGLELCTEEGTKFSGDPPKRSYQKRLTQRIDFYFLKITFYVIAGLVAGDGEATFNKKK